MNIQEAKAMLSPEAMEKGAEDGDLEGSGSQAGTESW